MKMVMLWSDYFVYLIVVMAIVLFWQISRNPQSRQKWRQVIYRPLNCFMMMILLGYCSIGVLDSIHFESDNGVISVLDEILTPMRVQSEHTYSAPFAVFGFTKETIKLPDGKFTRDYPRLQYGGAHLKSTAEKDEDIKARLLLSSMQAFIVFLAFAIVFMAIGCFRQRSPFEEFLVKIIKGNARFCWRSFLATLALMVFVVLLIYNFMPYYHIFGTDQVGEDVLYQSLKSIRTGLIIGTLTTIVMLPFAILFGAMAGYFRGWIDDVIQYVYTTLNSIPGVLLIAAAVLTLQIVMDRHTDLFQTVMVRSDARLLALCAILGITSWTELCRLLRGETLKISQMDYVQAAYSLGVSHFKILLRHVLPNVTHIILITIALNFSGLVLAEAVLSYVGVGVDPTTYSWGMMINSARLEMARVPVIWWSLAAAFIFMFILVLAANVFSDAVRDAFDPQSTES